MKWNGIVSQSGQTAIAPRFATAKANHASSTFLSRRKPIASMANGLDWCIRAELLAQTSDANLDHVRPGIEMEAPHLREKALSADYLSGVADQVVEQEIGRAS